MMNDLREKAYEVVREYDKIVAETDIHETPLGHAIEDMSLCLKGDETCDIESSE